MALPYIISSPLSISEPSLLRLTSSGGFIDIIPSNNLSSDYNFILPSNIGNSGEYLTTDGIGNYVWSSDQGPLVKELPFLTENSLTPFTLTNLFVYTTIPGTTLDLSSLITGDLRTGIYIYFSCFLTLGSSTTTSFEIRLVGNNSVTSPPEINKQTIILTSQVPTMTCNMGATIGDIDDFGSIIRAELFINGVFASQFCTIFDRSLVAIRLDSIS